MIQKINYFLKKELKISHNFMLIIEFIIYMKLQYI